jgi:hypothetical protein
MWFDLEHACNRPRRTLLVERRDAADSYDWFVANRLAAAGARSLHRRTAPSRLLGLLKSLT